MSRASRARARAPNGWAGGPPRPAAPLAWRLVLGLLRASAAILGLRLRVDGREHLPPGPCLVAAAPHRTWLDPFVLLFALPVEPRVHFLGDGEAIYRDAFRSFFIRRLGGVVPIWKGSRGIDGHVDAVREILRSGARLALFPERGPSVPVERARPFAAGIGYLALRTGAPVVPAVIGGTHELYLGRRIAVRFLPPIRPARPAGRSGPPGTPDEEHASAAGSPHERAAADERAAAHALAQELGEAMAPHVAELFYATEPPAGFRKRWQWLTTAFH